MAPFVPRVAWSVQYFFRDNNSKLSSTSTNITGTATYADAEASAAVLAATLENISNARLVYYTITREVANGLTTAPPPESEVERKLIVPLGTANFEKIGSLAVPSPIFSIEIADTDQVNPLDLNVIALRDAIVNGAVGAGNGFSTFRGEDYTRTSVPFVSHRNRRKA
jgi:hypothetical protein